MLIDWFTVIAQAVNFLVLVWLMKRYLYQPILNALDAREKHIAAELADADAKVADAIKERDEFKRRNDEFDQQRATMLHKATDDAATERNRLYEAARTDADGFRDKLQDKLSGEYRTLYGEIARRTQEEVFAIARKTLADLAGAGLEERMVEVLVRRLDELDGAEKKKLAAMFRSPDMPVLVRSAFELAQAQRAMIETAVSAILGAVPSVRYEIVPDLVAGIEIIMQGQKIAWNIADYLVSLDKDVNELLNMQRMANIIDAKH